MATIKPTAEAIEVLKNCIVEGNVIKLPDGQLERNIYAEVKKHLELIGGAWKGGKTYGFVFEVANEDLQKLLDMQSNGDGRNLKKEYQFFATPKPLADRMAQLCSVHGFISPKAKILEPSAGDGALIKALQDYYPTVSTVDCMELMDINRAKLGNIPGACLKGNDFLEAVEADTMNLIRSQYDVIIGNPPFSKNQDIDHIRAMYRCCKTNGRIVTIASPSWVSGSQKKQVEFRDWLKKIDAYQEEIPAGTFKESGTNVAAMLLVIDKLEVEDPAAPAIAQPSKIYIPGGFNSPEEKPNADEGEVHTTPWFNPGTIGGDPEPLRQLLNSKKTTNNMKKIISIPASPLISVLKKVKEVISKHPTLTVLTNIMIKVRRKDIQIIASDLMVTIQANIDVSNDHDFGYEYLLPFDFLFNICNLINGLDLTVEIETVTKKTDGKKVEVHNAILTTFADTFIQEDLDGTSDWPAMPEFPQENSVGIGEDFIVWLNKAIDTASTDKARPAMQKIFLDIVNEGISLASTNAHVVFEKNFPAESQNAVALLVNTKIAKALKGFKNTTISWSETHIAFVSDHITMIGTIQDETFPNYRAVFPQDYTGNLKLSLSELTGVMEKTALTNAPAIMYLKREIGHIVIESFDTNYNRKITVRIGADYSGNCDQIIVNPENMLLLLNQIDYVTLNLCITESNKPIIITSDSDNSYRALTMPMSV